MAVSDIFKYNAEMEGDVATLRQIYNTLSRPRQELLEATFRKLIFYTQLLAELLPAASMKSFVLDFDGYRHTATKDIKKNPDRWSPELIHLFARPSQAIMLPHAYLAVREWNQGGFYAPDMPAMWVDDENYPLQGFGTQPGDNLQRKVERLVLLASEPLDVEGDLMAKPEPRDEDDLPPAPADSSD